MRPARRDGQSLTYMFYLARVGAITVTKSPVHSLRVDEFCKKQLIAPWAQSVVPETCRGAAIFAILVEDSVRRAKADFPLVPLCPVVNIAQSLDGPLAWATFRT